MTHEPRWVILAQWTVGGAAIGAVCGVASAVFLYILELATDVRPQHPAFLYCLPLAGLLMGFFYERFGAAIKPGTNLVIDTIHDAGPQIPLRMAPMVLMGTVLTHLFGGSAGREGTAVQMGASLADWLAHRVRGVGGESWQRLRQQFVAAGVAAGFGAVFGTPAAGVVFGLEFVTRGYMQYRALIPALVAAMVGDSVTRALGIMHTPYPTLTRTVLTPPLFLKWFIFAAAVALVTVFFIELTHGIKRLSERYVGRLPYRMALGGVAVVALSHGVGTEDYLGLGVPVILRAFSDPSLSPYAFALKALFTAITLGAGFLGGEVTPLFFVGATLGNALAPWLGIPIDLAAGVGMAAVFASAANTPLAVSLMAVELFGSAALPHVLVVGSLAYLFKGQRSIYPAQRMIYDKS